MTKILDRMSNKEFETLKTALVKRKLTSEKSYDQQISEANMIAGLTKEDVFEFYKINIVANSSRKISVHVIGTGKGEEIPLGESRVSKVELMTNRTVDGKQVITNLEAFKKSLELFPVFG